MKKLNFDKKLLLACVCAFAVASCMSVPTKKIASPHVGGGKAQEVANRRDITFSVEVYSNSGLSSICSESDIILSIRETFARSGMFGRVNYVVPQNAGPFHYHFRIDQTGNLKSQFFAGLVSAASLTCIPVWINTDVKWIMRYQVNGKDIHIATSQHGNSDVVWAPLVITLPFMNHEAAGKEVAKNAMSYFLREIYEKKLNSIQ